jgi:tRNA (cmo5U34)-methyltransferase
MSQEEGWKSREAAIHYSQIADILLPGREEILAIIAEMATSFVSGPPKILDLGCGYGDVTNAILNLNPQASVFMVDFSDEMLKQSAERFKENRNIRIIRHDLNEGILGSLATEKFDAVVSCFALHHIEFAHRVKLYTDIYKILKEDGLFINGDRFKGDSPAIDQWEFDNWIKWMAKQIKGKGRDKSFAQIKQSQIESDKKLGDKPGTIWDMERDLRKAGFRQVDCVCKHQILAVLVSAK